MNIKYSLSLGLLITLLVVLPAQASESEVNLIINHQPVQQRLKIVKGRTLVPAQVVVDHFDAQLNWQPEAEELTLITNDLGIKFKLGSPVAVMNSQVIPLVVAPFKIEGQPFISLRVLQKIYGGYLTWKPQQKTIDYRSNQLTNLDVTTSSTEAELLIEATTIPDYKVKLLHRPQRLVIDLKEVNRSEVNKLLPVDHQIIDQVRVSQFKIDPAVTRVVVDLNRFSSYQVSSHRGKLAVQIIAEPKVVTSSIRDKQPQLLQPQAKRIVIDPGHGGHDPGAIGISGVEEKKVNLQLATQLAKLLEQQGYRTLLTRTADQFIPLTRRARLANQWSADIFISIHANFNYQSQINGTATYAHWHSSKQNWALAWYVQSELIGQIDLKDNGLKAADFVVLRETELPAILVETAFLSNPREEQLLVDPQFQQRAVQGLAAGINKYFQ